MDSFSQFLMLVVGQCYWNKGWFVCAQDWEECYWNNSSKLKVEWLALTCGVQERGEKE